MWQKEIIQVAKESGQLYKKYSTYFLSEATNQFSFIDSILSKCPLFFFFFVTCLVYHVTHPKLVSVASKRN